MFDGSIAFETKECVREESERVDVPWQEMSALALLIKYKNLIKMVLYLSKVTEV